MNCHSLSPPPEPAHPILPAMQPGRYFRLRREAARLSIDQLAMKVSNQTAERIEIAGRIRMLEDGLIVRDHGDLAALLRYAVPIDVGIFLALTARYIDPESNIPVPPVCVLCGCTWSDPCVNGHGQPCCWVEGAKLHAGVDLCTHCLDRPEVPFLRRELVA